MTTQEQFAAKVKELIAQSRSLTPIAQKNVIDLLNEARKQIVAELVNMDATRYTAAQLNALKLSIDQTLDQFRQSATAAVQRYQQQSAKDGTRLVDGPMTAVLGPMPLGQISTDTLAIVQGYTADLITGLSRKAAADVNAVIARAFLGGQSITDIIAQIGNATSGGKYDGLFGTIGERAQTIATNEILRVNSMAAQARFEDLAQHHPDLQKQWFHIPAAKHPRALHILASGQVVDVDQPFNVAGEELMYPRDPNGSPWNTINCHCLMRPFFSEDALKATAKEKGILDSLGISISGAAA